VRLRILMVSQRLPPRHTSGAPLQALAQARALSALGHEVSLLTTELRGGLPSRDEVGGVRVHRLRVLAGAPALSRLARVASYIAHRRHELDVVHAHALSAASLGAVVGARAAGLPVVVKPSLGGAKGEIARLRRSLAAPLVRRLLQCADRYLVLDEDIRGDLRRLGVPDDKLLPFHNGVELGRFSPSGSDEERRGLRERLGVCEAGMVLFVGQLIARKGLPVLLGAWRLVQAARPGAVLLLAGEGPARRALEARSVALGGVRWLGARDDVAALLRAADALVLPSAAESFGNVLVEALAAGVPVVASRTGLLRSLEPPPGCGRIVDPLRAGALGEALLEVLGAPYDEGRVAARRALAARYDVSEVARQLAALYEGLRREGRR
jgi:glycosyltransferase involved in cell wall biosynthesis